MTQFPTNDLHKYFSAHLNLRESDHLLPDLGNCCLRLFPLLVSKLCFFKWDSFRPSDASLVLSASLFGNISLCSPFLCLSASGMRDYWILSGDDYICLWCWTQEVKMPAQTSFIFLRQILKLGYLFVKYIEYDWKLDLRTDVFLATDFCWSALSMHNTTVSSTYFKFYFSCDDRTSSECWAIFWS